MAETKETTTKAEETEPKTEQATEPKHEKQKQKAKTDDAPKKGKPCPKTPVEWALRMAAEEKVATIAMQPDHTFIWNGNRDWPLFVGLPYANQEQVLQAELSDGGSIFKVGVSPEHKCGIYLRADVYDKETLKTDEE